MTRRRAVVALGSNLGDRAGYLRRGLALVATHDDVTVSAVSPVYETAPVGGPDDRVEVGPLVVDELEERRDGEAEERPLPLRAVERVD